MDGWKLKKFGGHLSSIYTSLYSAVWTTLHPSRSIISILSFTLFPFLTGPLNHPWGPVPLLSHAFFLSKSWLCSSAPLRAPQSFYSSIVASRKTFISHLFLQTHQPTPNQHPHARMHISFFHIHLLPSSLQKKAGKECRCWTHLSSFVILSFLLTHFFPLQTPVDGAVATSQSEHTGMLNHTREAVHHNSCMLVCCLSLPLALLTWCLNLYMSIILQCMLTSLSKYMWKPKPLICLD